MYLIRKFNKTSSSSKFMSDCETGLLESDLISEFKTSQNTLSFWLLENMDEIDEICTVILSTGNAIEKTCFAYFKVDDIQRLGITIEKSPGITPYKSRIDDHRDLSNLTVKDIYALGKFYHEKFSNCSSDNLENQEFYYEVQKKEAAELLVDAVRKEKIQLEDCTERLKREIKKKIDK